MLASIRKFRVWYQKPRSRFGEFVELVLLLVLVFIIRSVGFGLYAVPSGSMETTMLCGERFFADKFTPLFVPFKHGDVITIDEPTYQYSKNPLFNWWQHWVGFIFWGTTNWTKRVIGVPGDHIEGKIEEGKPVVYRNGQKLDEPYVNKYPLIGVYRFDNLSPLSLPVFRSYVPGVPFEQQPFYRMSYSEVMYAKQLLTEHGYEDIRYPYTPATTYSNNTEKSPDIFDVHLGPDEYWAMGDNRRDSTDSRFWGTLKRNFIHGKVKFCLYSIDLNESWGKLEFFHIFPFDMLRHPIDFWSRVRWSRCLSAVY
jgi:signal peptidase I